MSEILLSDSVSIASSLSSPASHTLTGTLKPCFLRLSILVGTTLDPALFSMCFLSHLLSFNPVGIVAASSTSSWSSIGTLASKEFAMLILSTLTSMSPGR
jgi:hypothetical protein